MIGSMVRTFGLAAAVSLVAAACLDDSIGVPRDLQVTLTAEEDMVPLGDSAIVHVSAEGRNLTDVTIHWGDGDTLEHDNLAGAVEFERRASHLYQEAGSYQVLVSVLEFGGGTAEATTTIEVQEGAGS